MPTIDINIVLAIVAFTWHYALFCGYISDDHAAVRGRKDIIPDDEKKDRGESFWVKRFNDGIVVFYINQIFWKLGFKDFPFPWHLFSLILHLANVYLIHILFLPILGYQASLFCACFWGVNPMLNQNVVWISGRPYVIGTFLALIAMLCWQQPYVFIPFYMLAVITNIGIFFAPVLLWILHPTETLPKIYLLSMVLLAGPFVVWKFQKRFTKGLVIDRDNFAFRKRKVFTFARMVLYYTWAFFTPVRMGWYHQQGFRYNERWEKFNYQTFIGFLILAFYLYKGLPGWWILLGMLPVCNIFATNSFLQDRYMYFFSIGIAFIVSPIFVAYPWLFISAVTFYGARSYMYSRHMKNDEMVYRENWRNHQHSDYAINNLVYFLIQQRRWEEAKVMAERGLAINQHNKMLWYNKGICLAAQGHFNNDAGKLHFLGALDCWKICLQLEPRWEKPANDIKRLIKMLVDNKVLTLNKDEARQDGSSISIPQIVGMKEMIDGAITASSTGNATVKGS